MLHALLAVLVLRAANRAALRAPPPPQEVVELELELDLDVDVGIEPDVPADPDRQAKADGAPKADRARAAAPSPGRTRTEPPSQGADDGPEMPADASPVRSEERPATPSRIDLSLGVLPDEIKGRVAGPPPLQGTLRAKPGRFAVDELRVELERQQDAVANVDSGRADPLLYDYLRGARSRFQEDAERLADDLAVGPGDMVRSWGRGYLRTVEDKNRGLLGARTDAPREGGGDARNETSPGADVLGGYRQAQRQAEAGAEERRAEVCLNVAAGRETAVALRRGSGNAALDRLTLESFTKAVAARPVPPDARPGLACYELRISAYRMPPLPFVSCGVGRNGLTCVWPFKKVTSVKGRLLSVEYPPAAGGSGQRSPSLLRKPR